MWVVSYRDETEVTALRQPKREVRNYLGRIAADLAGALDATGRAGGPIAVTLAHAVQFATWQSLKEQGASDAAMVELVMDWLTGVRD